MGLFKLLLPMFIGAILLACSLPTTGSGGGAGLTAASFAGTYIGQAAYDNAGMNPPYKIVIDNTGLGWTEYDKSASSSMANPTINLNAVYPGDSNWYQLLVGGQFWVINLTGSTLSVRYVNLAGGSFAAAYASLVTYTYTKQ